jgi:SSS family solute:Na+ symporter
LISFTDQLIIIAYFGLLLASLFVRSWKSNTAFDYVLAGRRVTLFPFVATMVATAYGWVLGIGELYYSFGISAWLFLSLPYSLFFMLFAIFFAKRSRESKYATLPDLLADKYGKKVAVMGSLLILLISSPAMYILMTAQILHYVWNIDITLCLAISTFFSMVYLFNGGFKTVVNTDLFQFVLMFAGFATVVVTLFIEYGIAPIDVLPEKYTSFHIKDSLWYVISWFLLASVTLVDPNYHQRVYSVDKPATAQKGLIISVLCWTIFDFLAAASALYAISLMPGIENRAFTYLELGSRFLPMIVTGIFFVGLLATVVSTTNSFLFTSALSLSKDLLHRNGLLLKYPVEKLTNASLVVISFMSFIIAWLYRDSSAVALFFDVTPVVAAVLLLPVLASFFPLTRIKGSQVLVQMLFAFCVTILYQLLQPELGPEFVQINSVYFGLTASLLLHLFFLLSEKRTPTLPSSLQ